MYLLFWGKALTSIAQAQPLSAEDAVRAAFLSDPAYHQALTHVTVAQQSLQATRLLLENPSLSLEPSLTSPQWSLSLVQPLSPNGHAIRLAAQTQLSLAQSELWVAALSCAAQTRLQWAEVVASQTRVRLAWEILEQTQKQRQAIENKLKVGESSLLDAQLLRLGEAEAAATWLGNQQEHHQARTELARLIGDLSNFSLPDDPLLAVPLPTGPTEQPELRAAELRSEAARLGERIEQLAVIPTVGLGVFVEQDDTLSVGPLLDLSVPLWNWNQQGRAQAQAERSLAQLQAASTRAGADEEITQYQDTLDRLAPVLVALVPDPTLESEAAMAAVDAAWNQGEIDTVTAILLQKELLSSALGAITLRLETTQVQIGALLSTADLSLIPVELREALP